VDVVRRLPGAVLVVIEGCGYLPRGSRFDTIHDLDRRAGAWETLARLRGLRAELVRPSTWIALAGRLQGPADAAGRAVDELAEGLHGLRVPVDARLDREQLPGREVPSAPRAADDPVPAVPSGTAGTATPTGVDTCATCMASSVASLIAACRPEVSGLRNRPGA
jgi:hypothetical protein